MGWRNGLRANWGSGEQVLALAYDPDDRLGAWAGRLERRAAGPGMAEAFFRMQSEIDVRPVLPSIQARTLVICRPDAKDIDVRHSRYFAEHIPNARLWSCRASTRCRSDQARTSSPTRSRSS